MDLLLDDKKDVTISAQEYEAPPTVRDFIDAKKSALGNLTQEEINAQPFLRKLSGQVSMLNDAVQYNANETYQKHGLTKKALWDEGADPKVREKAVSDELDRPLPGFLVDFQRITLGLEKDYNIRSVGGHLVGKSDQEKADAAVALKQQEGFLKLRQGLESEMERYKPQKK